MIINVTMIKTIIINIIVIDVVISNTIVERDSFKICSNNSIFDVVFVNKLKFAFDRLMCSKKIFFLSMKIEINQLLNRFLS